MFFKFLEISNPPTPHFFSDWLWPYCDIPGLDELLNQRSQTRLGIKKESISRSGGSVGSGVVVGGAVGGASVGLAASG